MRSMATDEKLRSQDIADESSSDGVNVDEDEVYSYQEQQRIIRRM
jgi:hypothetical protein